MQRSRWTIVSALFLVCVAGAADAAGPVLSRLKLADGSELEYLLQMPTGNGGRKKPGLLLALPCADGSRRMADMDMKNYWADEGARRGYIVACPLVRNGKLHAQEGKTDIKPLVEHLKKTYNIDPARIAVGGCSNGGIGAFEAIQQNPDLFAAALLMPGYNIDTNRKLDKLAAKKFFLRYGERDSGWAGTGKALAETLKKLGCTVDHAELAGQGHMLRIAPKELYDWIDNALKG